MPAVEPVNCQVLSGAQKQICAGIDGITTIRAAIAKHTVNIDGMSKRLLELGFKDVRTLRGGLRAWTDAGFEVEEGAGVRSQESGVRGRDEG